MAVFETFDLFDGLWEFLGDLEHAFASAVLVVEVVIDLADEVDDFGVVSAELVEEFLFVSRGGAEVDGGV